jgi:predicted transposase YbfD/YdcC
MMVKPLIEVLAEIPDFRKAKGKRHPLSAILALACVAVMCGCRGYRAIAEWGRNYDNEFTEALGFTHAKTPCASTLHTIFGKISVKLVEKKLGEWAESIVGAGEEATQGEEAPQGEAATSEGVSIDGKTLRGSLNQESSITHLLSAVSHKLGLTMAQCSVDSKTNEIGTMDEILQNIVLKGRIFTTDAMHTQRDTCQTIVDGEGDYVMIVKDNQHNLLDDVKTTFHGPCSHMLDMSSDHSVDCGHGRIEERHLTVCDELSPHMDWPGVKQVFMVTRNTSFKNGKKKSRSETVYGITSLSPEQADASCLQQLVRCHWHIENRSHWVRDVTFGEDHSQVRSGNIPQVMAAFRNTAIGLIRWLGHKNIASACRYFAAQPWDALEAIGISR